MALPQSPSRLRPDRFPNRARAARGKVLQRMEQLGVLTARQVEEAHQILPHQRRLLPFIAPHLADRLRTMHSNLTLHQSFIDRSLQQNLETPSQQQQGVLEPYRSMAMLVVANRDRRVLAMSAPAIFDARRAGQVDMIRAIRSPGSTLKPLIYGLGFDDLLIHPETLTLKTLRPALAAIAPPIFHHTYAGQLTVREALQQSLNIPAVAVLEQPGQRGLQRDCVSRPATALERGPSATGPTAGPGWGGHEPGRTGHAVCWPCQRRQNCAAALQLRRSR